MHGPSTANVRDPDPGRCGRTLLPRGCPGSRRRPDQQAGPRFEESLYATFGSKEALIVAYLDVRRTSIEETITHGLARLDAPRDRLLGVFEIQGDTFASPDFYGCPFLAASAEAAPGSLVERAHADYRAWVRALLTELAAEAYLPSGLDRDFWHWWPDPDGKLLALCPLASTDTFQLQIGVSADAAEEFSRRRFRA